MLRRMVDQHSHQVFRLAWRMLGNEADAEEVVQETFLRAWRNLDDFQGNANEGTWLYRITTNCALDLIRSRKRSPTMNSDPEIGDQIQDGGKNPEQYLYNGQIRQQVEQSMRKLAPKERSAFALRHFAECSIAEISHILGIKPDAVKQAIFRAVNKLRVGLESK